MKNKLSLSFYTFLVSIFVTLIPFNNIIAQDKGIIELKENSTLSKNSSDKNKKNDREGFYNLAFKLHPTAYVKDNNFKSQIETSNSVSKLTFNDTKSFGIVNNNHNNLNNVELITVTLHTSADLNNKLILIDNSNFGNLKYVYIKCFFDCTEQQIKEFISSDTNVRVFYKIEIPS